MTQALQHPLKQAFSADGYPWLLAQTYAALGLGTSGDKMKAFRAQLEPGRDWLEYRDPAHNNSKRICYTPSGVSAIAQKLGTAKALHFAQLVASHRAEVACPGAIVVAREQAVTPVDTTYRMARQDGDSLQPIAATLQPLEAYGWQALSQEQGGALAGQTLVSESMSVKLPDQVSGNVIINQGTIHYHAPEKDDRPLLTLTPETWQKGAMALLFIGVLTPLFFLYVLITTVFAPRTVNVHMEAPARAPLSY